MELKNYTDFKAGRYAVKDEDGIDLLMIAVKAVYDIRGNEKLSVAMKQSPPEMADQYYGKPEHTSLKYASDFSIGKCFTDIALIGYAYPIRKNSKESYVSLKVGKISRVVKVFGDRKWESTLGIPGISSPASFERIPLIWEKSFGGIDKSHPNSQYHEYEARNPVGVGFRARVSKARLEGSQLPNFEDPNNLVKNRDDRPGPMGFGFISPAWQPRISYCGTYDLTWEKARKPMLPIDFDRKFYNASPPDLIYPGLMEGNEPVEVAGASPSGTMRFRLPTTNPLCVAQKIYGQAEQIGMGLDKVVIHAEKKQLSLVWSGTLKVDGGYQEIESVVCETERRG